MMGATACQVCSKLMMASLLAFWCRAEQLSISRVRPRGCQMTSGHRSTTAGLKLWRGCPAPIHSITSQGGNLFQDVYTCSWVGWSSSVTAPLSFNWPRNSPIDDCY